MSGDLIDALRTEHADWTPVAELARKYLLSRSEVSLLLSDKQAAVASDLRILCDRMLDEVRL